MWGHWRVFFFFLPTGSWNLHATAQVLAVWSEHELLQCSGDKSLCFARWGPPFRENYIKKYLKKFFTVGVKQFWTRMCGHAFTMAFAFPPPHVLHILLDISLLACLHFTVAVVFVCLVLADHVLLLCSLMQRITRFIWLMTRTFTCPATDWKLVCSLGIKFRTKLEPSLWSWAPVCVVQLVKSDVMLWTLWFLAYGCLCWFFFSYHFESHRLAFRFLLLLFFFRCENYLFVNSMWSMYILPIACFFFFLFKTSTCELKI